MPFEPDGTETLLCTSPVQSTLRRLLRLKAVAGCEQMPTLGAGSGVQVPLLTQSALCGAHFTHSDLEFLPLSHRWRQAPLLPYP